MSDPTPPPPTDFPAAVLAGFGGDYDIERELHGGMSRVFVATERALGRRVVIKILPPELAAGLNVERFRREIQLAARLQHPHIVPLLAAGETDGLLWFTMPFIEGESLRTLLERRGRLGPDETVRYLQDIVDALAYAHGQGIVHRDIKPENVLLSGSHAVITDFGVAKALSAAIPLTGHTTTGMAIGTPAYMAPEQLAADPSADHRVDLYAVGLLAYELLTGQSPFRADSPQATLAAQLTQRPTPVAKTIRDVPEALSALIDRCLEKEAAARPADARTLLSALEGVARATHAPPRAPSRGQKVGAGLAVVAVAVLAFVLGRDGANGADGLGADGAPRARRGSTAVAVPETVVVYRDAGSGGDTALGTSLPVVIARAESLAIANAMTERRQRASAAGAPRADAPGGGAAAAPANPDSLVAAISRLFADSMARAVARLESTYAENPRQRELQALVTESGSGAFVGDAVRRLVRGAIDIGAAVSRGDSLAPPSTRGSSQVLPPPPGERPTLRRPEGDRRGGALGPDEIALLRLAPRLAPPAPGVQRVAFLGVGVADRRLPRPFAHALRDSLRATLAASGPQVELADSSVVRRVAELVNGERIAIGYATRSSVVVDARLLQDGDSLVLVSLVTDVRAGIGTRAFRTAVAGARADDATLAALLAPTRDWIRTRLGALTR